MNTIEIMLVLLFCAPGLMIAGAITTWIVIMMAIAAWDWVNSIYRKFSGRDALEQYYTDQARDWRSNRGGV